MRVVLLALILIFGAVPGMADSLLPPAQLANQPLPDKAQEEKAQALMHTLRCLVCQNQSIADSNAEMAGDMRALVRERIAAGEDPEAIRRWLIERFGDWVSFNPPIEPATWLLWGAPFIFLGAGAVLVRRYYRKGGA